MDPKQLTFRADKLYAQDHTVLAASYYRRALEIDPDYAPALVGNGRSILRAKKYADAMKNATRALQLTPLLSSGSSITAVIGVSIAWRLSVPMNVPPVLRLTVNPGRGSSSPALQAILRRARTRGSARHWRCRNFRAVFMK